MKRFVCAFLLIVGGVFGAAIHDLEAATLHTIIVADINDATIGQSVTMDAVAMESEMRNIAAYSSMDLNPRVFAGKTFVRDDVLNYVKKLEIKPEDDIIFFWAGHGYRTESKETKWPALFFGWGQKGMDLGEVVKIITKKKPNMAFIMADTCNNILPDNVAPNFISKRFFASNMEKAYRALFRDFKGVVVTASADVGETAKGNNVIGGFYTNAFLQSLRKEIQSTTKPKWKVILQNSHDAVTDYEHPIYEIYKY